MDEDIWGEIQFCEMTTEREMTRSSSKCKESGDMFKYHLLRKTSRLTSAAGLEKKPILCVNMLPSLASANWDYH